MYSKYREEKITSLHKILTKLMDIKDYDALFIVSLGLIACNKEAPKDIVDAAYAALSDNELLLIFVTETLKDSKLDFKYDERAGSLADFINAMRFAISGRGIDPNVRFSTKDEVKK